MTNTTTNVRKTLNCPDEVRFLTLFGIGLNFLKCSRKPVDGSNEQLRYTEGAEDTVRFLNAVLCFKHLRRTKGVDNT